MFHVDDLVTIVVDEDNDAMEKAGSSSDVESRASARTRKGHGALSFIPSADAAGESEAEYDGHGSTVRKGRVKAVVSAHVVSILSNGNLVVEGAKQVAVNDETEILRVSGVVRPEDVDSENTILSSRLGDAKISYTGRGGNSNAMSKGVLASFLDWLF